MRMARRKVDWVLSGSAHALLRLSDCCSGADAIAPRSVRVGGLIGACRHTNAWARQLHAVWSPMFCRAKRNR